MMGMGRDEREYCSYAQAQLRDTECCDIRSCLVCTYYRNTASPGQDALTEFFNGMDVDGNGLVDAEEFTDAIMAELSSTRGRVSERQLEMLFKIVDVTNDGQVCTPSHTMRLASCDM